MMEKIMIFHHGNQIADSDLPLELNSATPKTNMLPPENLSLKQAIASLEQQYIHAALQQTGGNRVQAAKILEISLRSLHYKIKDYGIA